jgi:hypothetical protein
LTNIVDATGAILREMDKSWALSYVFSMEHEFLFVIK